MVTSVLFQKNSAKIPDQELTRENRAYAAGLITGLTAAALFIHGFHPYAEDGGLYLAGVKRVLDPSLYASSPEFVLGHLRFSAFAPAMAWMVRTTGIRLEAVLLLVHLASIWLTLWAAWMLTRRCFVSLRQRTGAVALLAVWLTLPVAGTSLMLMDPYVTARSISTPLTLLALVCAIDFLRSLRNGSEHWGWSRLAFAVVTLAVAGLAHPLMAAYGFGCVLTLSTTMPESRTTRRAAIIALGAAAILVAAGLTAVAQPESVAYHSVAMSRAYWFLSAWRWYEVVGAVAPLAILGFFAWREPKTHSERWALTQMCVTAGSIALVVALLFAREGSATHIVARLQPMRIFQLIYIVMILFLGASLARWMGRRTLRWAGVFAVLATMMYFAERATFPASAHIELMEFGSQPVNAWAQAFEWVRQNTPKNAVFALDADYITRPGEDAQCFRAIAERSALPDYSKDGGEAAITPALTEEWKAGQDAQERLSERSDRERLASLAPKGVEWVVLKRDAVTGFSCDYANAAVKVCRLPNEASADSDRLSLQRQQALHQTHQQAQR